MELTAVRKEITKAQSDRWAKASRAEKTEIMNAVWSVTSGIVIILGRRDFRVSDQVRIQAVSSFD